MRSSLLHHHHHDDTDDNTKNKFLIVPDLNHNTDNEQRCLSPDPFIPRHSDFTIPTSNRKLFIPDTLDNQNNDNDALSSSTPTHTNAVESSSRRSIFGDKVQFKSQTTTTNGSTSSSMMHHVLQQQQQHDDEQNMTPPASPIFFHETNHNTTLSPLTPHDGKKKVKHLHHTHHNTHSHVESLLLGFAFLCVWTPQNILAPNLTEIAQQFGFSPRERDVYLGANLALATGVLSLPLSACIGILADVYNRKHLYIGCVLVGALASAMTGLSRNYHLLFWSRLLNGGCMSGSVPVAFSLLGDLFSTRERNAASSGLTAMMGIGIIAGQVYAGMISGTKTWSHAFYVSSGISILAALLVIILTREPIRGGKEHVLQEMLLHGTRYERKLDWNGFRHAILQNKSNSILLQQGFFSSVPWGIMFCFLNDYLSQELGFTVQDATFLVLVFGIGCAAGGVLGGYWGQVIQSYRTSYLPIFMAITTFVGIVPFLILLNSTFDQDQQHNARHSLKAILCCLLGGCIASLPSVNVRPCLLNVNPPETRGAALTAANLIINLARGAGPSCITVMGALWGVHRQFSFNVTLTFFWTISAIQLLFLSRSLPRDQDAMETELARYAKHQITLSTTQNQKQQVLDEEEVSIEDRMTSFDAGAARETVHFLQTALRELSDELFTNHFACQNNGYCSSDDEEESLEDMEKKRQLWIQQQQRDLLDSVMIATEETPLVIRSNTAGTEQT